MKNTSISIIALLGCIAVMSVCTGKSKSSESLTISVENDNKVPIYVNMEGILKKEGTEQLSTTATEITYIPLELTDNSILKGVLKVEVLNGKYVICDYNTGLFLFDQNGKYIKNISRSGQGPSDYPTFVHNIIVDHEANNLYLFATKKIIKFNKNADYVSYFYINDGSEGVYDIGTYTPQNTIILGYKNKAIKNSDTSIIYNAIEVDTIGNIINKFVNHSPRYTERPQFQIGADASFLGVFNNNVRFMDFYNDTIFNVSRKTMVPYAILNLGKDKTASIRDINTSRPPTQKDLDAIAAKSTGHSIVRVQENEDYLFTILTEKGLSGKLVNSTYNKHTKELKLLKNKGLLNDLDGGPDFFPLKCIGDIMIGWKMPHDFKNEVLSKDYNEQKAKYGDRFEKVYQLAKSLQEDDNPILMVVKK